MDEGRDKAQWYHTSGLIAAFYEQNRDRKKRKEPFAPSDFNPYEIKKKSELKVKEIDPKMGFMILKSMFVKPDAADVKK